MAVDGTYNVQVSSPMGTQPATITLRVDGEALTGSISGDQGTQAFENGTVDGDSVAWSVQMTGPMGQINLDFKGTVSGDEISGEIKLGSFGTATFKGNRT